MKIDIQLIVHEKNCKDKLFKLDYGYYDYDEKEALILLYNAEINPEKKLISEIISTINHEYLHGVIGIAREEYGEKPLFDFFEEKIIREILGEDFDPEQYYEYVQIDEETYMKTIGEE